MEHETSRNLALLLRHYSALSPSTPALIPSPPFPSSRTLSLPTTQLWIVENLLPIDHEPPQESIRGGNTWKKAFWRRIVKGIETGFEERKHLGDSNVEDEEVDADILDRMVEYLSTAGSSDGAGASPGQSERKYYWGDLEGSRQEWRCVRAREEGRMISGGTTGLRTWQACIALSNHFLADPSRIVESRNIVELGAGVGLLSLVAATLRQDQRDGKVISTDVDEKVLELLESNVRLNNLEDSVKTCNLDWELASKVASDGAAGLLEWEREAFGDQGRADLIIGADIVYDPSLTAHLAATISWLLRARPEATAQDKPAEAIIAGTIRNESTWELFLSECRSRQLRIDEVALRTLENGAGLVGAEGWENEGQVRVVRLTRLS
ncbi:protein-lysine N-methyltransferase [Sporobolomyces koalae]|uniref:protein-lysine N-methyltransferase n=1 Tax=Sporobolomyces koalae TaxID=500713 RepID=UPI003179AFFA